jgi:hypothetical protein
MAKVERTKVVVDSSYYNFDVRYEQAMEQFEDKKVISINVIDSKHDGDSIREEYLVFYEEIQEEMEDDCIEEGDFVYWHDVNTVAKIYETVEKVIFDDGLNKCFFLETEDSEGGFIELHQVTLVAKKKDRKDI